MILDFGKHALFIWLSYGVVAAGLVGLWFITRHNRITARRDLDQLRSLLKPPQTQSQQPLPGEK